MLLNDRYPDHATGRTPIKSVQGLILSANIIVGYQIASLLSAYGWRMQVVHTDRKAYALILQGSVDVVVADIDASNLGGMAVLFYCKHHRPSIRTFALTQGADAYLETLAHDMGGCEGFFYRTGGRLEIDTHAGMAARLVGSLDRGSHALSGQALANSPGLYPGAGRAG